MSTIDEFFRMLKQLLLWLLLFVTPTFIGFVVWYVYGLSVQMEKAAMMEGFESSVSGWTLLLGNILVIIVFIRKHYVQLSLGTIARQKVWPMIGITLLMGFALLFLHDAWYILSDIASLFPEQAKEMSEQSPMFTTVAGILYGCIFGPIAEEIVFRGVLVGGLLRMRCRPWLAILISALLFSLLHSLLVIVPTMIFAIVAGWLFWRTGSLIPGIIIHIANNSFSFLSLIGQENTPGTPVGIAILIACLLVLTLGFLWFEKKTPKLPQSICTKPQESPVGPSSTTHSCDK